MNKLDDAALAAIKERNPNGEILRDDSIDLYLVVRPPTRQEWKSFVLEDADPETRYNGRMKLIALIALYPTAGELAVYFDQKPAAVADISRKIAEIAGSTSGISREKL